jgi:hypothetical protein
LDHINEVILAVVVTKGDSKKYCPRVKGQKVRERGKGGWRELAGRQAGGFVLKGAVDVCLLEVMRGVGSRVVSE